MCLSMDRVYYRNKVRELRLKALIPSQAELARRSGICRTRICALENNRTALSIQYAFRLKKVLRCSLDDLYEEFTGERTESKGPGHEAQDNRVPQH